ncbi:hypothetical protein GOBAR_DD09331 [Gossypium barbadense]|nr:hypothetical protein GOBAR_DD09331 [Gossypium barbadense]
MRTVACPDSGLGPVSQKGFLRGRRRRWWRKERNRGNCSWDRGHASQRRPCGKSRHGKKWWKRPRPGIVGMVGCGRLGIDGNGGSVAVGKVGIGGSC